MHGTIDAMPSVTCEVGSRIPRLPTFKPRWWYSDQRFDARPVVWSLRNRPEEWEAVDSSFSSGPGWSPVTGRYPDGLRHKPSGHIFRYFGDHAQRLVSAVSPSDGTVCSCLNQASDRKPQLGQRVRLWSAMWDWVEWKNPRPTVDHRHFASHFVHD